VEEIKMNSKRGLKFQLSVSCLLLVAAIILGGIAFTPRNTSAQGSFNTSATSVIPNYSYPAMVFTATAQNKTQTIAGASSATVQIFGPATAATLQIFASNDGGTNYFAIPFTAGAYTTNVLQVTTPGTFPAYSGTPVIYWVNVAGMTNLKVATSGTFTGASASVKIVASPNKGLL
jgi:hypothetical protein